MLYSFHAHFLPSEPVTDHSNSIMFLFTIFEISLSILPIFFIKIGKKCDHFFLQDAHFAQISPFDCLMTSLMLIIVKL